MLYICTAAMMENGFITMIEMSCAICYCYYFLDSDIDTGIANVITFF